MTRLIRLTARSRAYQYLWKMEEGFLQVQRALTKIQRTSGSNARGLAQFGSLIAEARAATMSYLLEVIGQSETEEAGRLFSARRERERKKDF